MSNEQPSRTGVRAVRGPFVRLPQHREACGDRADLQALCSRIRAAEPTALLAADLFCGAGGLSLGLEQAGISVVMGVDHDPEALETHRHHMAGMSVDWDLGDAKVVAELGELLRSVDIDIIAGGPPCQPFSKAGRSLMRHLVREGLREPKDKRRDLWRSYLEVVRIARPRAVIMENVPDMALDREVFILRSMVHELESWGYSVEARVVEAWRYGVPQFRQRLILVALADGKGFTWPAESERKVTVGNAIDDLPRVEGGWRPKGGAHGWTPYSEPRTAFQRSMREGVEPASAHKVFDHITRPVREDDARAFELLDSESRYSDLPDDLKRYRDDIFDDKYKRLSGHDLSRTITAHIAKDGYWYIHPEQNRTLTVREAARLQTFPDHVRFAGPPSAAFRQIGNAVPPKLGAAVGGAVVRALNQDVAAAPNNISRALAHWHVSPHRTRTPWLLSGSPWGVLVGETLLERASLTVANALWPIAAQVARPADLPAALARLRESWSWIDKVDRVDRLHEIALAVDPDGRFSEDELARLVSDRKIPQRIADLMQLASPDGEEPIIVTPGALRVCSRLVRNQLGRRNKLTDGRLAIARAVGFGDNSRAAHLGLLELGTEVCTPESPDCGTCPLADVCLSAHGSDLEAE